MTSRPPIRPAPCESTRLAESPFASVDLCSCGSMHLHVGAITLRIPPDAISDLLSTLGQAIAAYALRRYRYDAEHGGFALHPPRRGKA